MAYVAQHFGTWGVLVVDIIPPALYFGFRVYFSRKEKRRERSGEHP